LNWKKLAIQWKALDRLVITASRISTHLLWMFLTIIGLVTVVVEVMVVVDV
jgi:hypothetical protein